MSLIDDLVQRADGWYNVITGIGTARDKSAYTNFGACIAPLPDTVLAAMYQLEDLSAKIVDVYPQEALSLGYEHAADAGGTGDLETEMADYERTLGVCAVMTDALIWSRLFGGGLLVVQTDSDADMSQPLGDFEAVTALKFLDKRYCNPTPNAVDAAGEPTSYDVYSDGKIVGMPTYVVHVSRLVVFGGARTEWRTKQARNRWDLSVLQRPFAALASDGAIRKSTEVLVQEASTGVFKVANLFALVSQGQKSSLLDRLRVLSLNKSVSRDILLDKDKEDYERHAVQFAGLPELTMQALKRVAAAAEIPVTVLLGEAPAGLNATGDSDLRWWLKRVNAYRTLTVEPLLRTLLGIVYRARSAPRIPVDAAGRPKVAIRWPNLWTPTESEQAEIYAKCAQADSAYITAQVLLPEEVALSRFGRDGFSIETTIDRDLREKALAGAPADPTADPTDPNADPVDMPEETKPADTAMNGAQVTSLIDVVAQVAAKTLPRESAKAILQVAFGLTPEQAEQVLGPAGESFVVDPPAPPPAFGQKPPVDPAVKPGDSVKSEPPPAPEPPADE